MAASTSDASDFVQMLREFMVAYSELTAIFDQQSPGEISFDSIQKLVGDDHHSVLYRLKERSHGLFRSDGQHRSETVRREALFDLAIGSLFHEAMKLRESLYQREVYAPRVASLRAASNDETDDLFIEFERILGKSLSGLNEVVAEVRILLAQTRDQLRRLLIERAADRVVTRFLLNRRHALSTIFPEGFEGLLEAMHGDVVSGLVEAGRSMLESAYFVDASQVLREATRCGEGSKSEIAQLMRYAEGMQAFLDGDYPLSLATLEDWADSGAPSQEREFARLAASALSRIDRLVAADGGDVALPARAKELQLRLDAGSG